MALAVHAAQTGHRRTLMWLLVATMVLGAAFLGIKSVEYYHKFEEHHIPGPGFVFEKEHFANVQLFFSLYFLMTGLHALHMIIGLGHHDLDAGVVVARHRHRRVLQPDRDQRPVLALRRHCLDLPLPTPVPPRTPRMNR
jgi:cytochrome c oxidase subunit 3